MSTKKVEMALERLDILKGTRNAWTAPAYVELKQIRRAAAVAVAMLKGGGLPLSAMPWKAAEATLVTLAAEHEADVAGASTPEPKEDTAPNGQERSITLAFAFDTSEAEARLERLRQSIATLTTDLEKLNAIAAPRTPSTAAQDPDAAYRTIREVLGDVKNKRLTWGQASEVLRAVIPSLGWDNVAVILQPLAEAEVPRPPRAPAIRLYWNGEDWPKPPHHNAESWAVLTNAQRRLGWVNQYIGGAMSAPEPTDAELRSYVGRVMAGLPGHEVKQD